MLKGSSSYHRLFMVALLLLPLFGSAQKAEDEAEKETVYKKQVVGGAFLHSNGWGFELNKGKKLTVDKKRMLSFGFANMKHPKEFKSYNPYYEDAKGYYFGKRNGFYLLRPSIGIKNVLFEKIRPGGVQVSYELLGGPSIGLLKPVYLEIGYPDIPYDSIAEERYDPDRHAVDNIYGRASWSKGLGELKLHPGLYGKFGMNFAFGGNEKGVQAIETGLMVDAFWKKVPIMAVDQFEEDISNKRVFLNLYVCLKYGKKYYR